MVTRRTVKDGICDEVRDIINWFHSLDTTFLHNKVQLEELRQIYEELPEYLEEVLSLELARQIGMLCFS
ncbi:hypothetical protein HanIR_Chr03g0130331 [Helianthus annuus]|nr:hypothetical protein HanIR_Chr03g0130331 [Helianthus annuus]